MKHSTATTKTHRSRRIPLHPELRIVLEAMPHPHTGRVFMGVRGGVLKPDLVLVVLKRDVLSKLAKDFPQKGEDPSIVNGRVHSFRHFFCSQCFRSGIPEADIKLWLGHSDSKMVAHYRHYAKGEQQKSISKFKNVGDPDAA